MTFLFFFDIIHTMNYIGSKYSILDFLISSIGQTLRHNNEDKAPQDMIFADLFAGTGVVGGAFKELGYSIIANDIQYYSYVMCRHAIANGGKLDESRCLSLVDELNNLDGVNGFIYSNYSYEGTEGQSFRRMYFTAENAKKCDAIRLKIEEWKDNADITEDEYFFLLASLLNSVDKYANTASVYGAFLKQIKKSAQQNMLLTPLPITRQQTDCHIYNEDISALITKVGGDILYLDPPYNERQYCTNYHLLETIARYDSPAINGKTGLREYSEQKSVFCKKNAVAAAFENIVKHAQFKYIFLSYNNEGLMSFEDIKKIMERYGTYKVYMQTHRRYKADNARESKATQTVEYLHCLIKKSNG